MAANNLAELERALINADAAGDTEAAQILAGEILSQRSAASAKDKSLITRANEAISSVMPESVNKAVDFFAQPVSGLAEGLVSIPSAVIDTVGAVTDPRGGETGILLLDAVRASRADAEKIAPIPRPMTGAEIDEALQEQGVTAPPAESWAGRVVRRMGREVGASVIPAAAVLQRAKTAATGAGAILTAARNAPGKFVAAETVAAGGAGAGAGIAKEIAPESTAAEITGLLVGAVAPTALAGSVRRLVRGGEGTRQAMEKTVKEFADAGIEPTVGMATRRRFNQAVESGLAILPGSSGRMAAYAEKSARKLYDNVDNVTAGIAPIRSADKAGAAIETGVKSYVQSFKAKWRRLDAQVNLDPKAAIRVANTRGTMVEMGDPVNLAAYPQLAKIAERLDTISQKGMMSYGDLRTFRSSVGALIPESYAASLPQGQLKKLYASLTDDLRAHLTATNPKALAAFERSNKYYAAAMNRLDERLAPILHSDIPERMFLALERSGHAGPTVINAAKRSIGKDNWDVVAGTIFQRMGMAKAGAQDAAGEIFSVETFLTNWNKYARNRGTIESLTAGTSGGAQFAKDMTAVAKVAERFREAGRVFANPSGTARAIANVGLGTSVATAAITGQVQTAATIMTVATAANLSARSFTNPKFVRFLARSTEVPAARIPGLMSRLAASLVDEPEDVQVEVAAFLDRLSDEFSAEAQRQ